MMKMQRANMQITKVFFPDEEPEGDIPWNYYFTEVFAYSLAGNHDYIDDIIQGHFGKQCRNKLSFVRGTVFIHEKEVGVFYSQNILNESQIKNLFEGLRMIIEKEKVSVKTITFYDAGGEKNYPFCAGLLRSKV